MKKKHVVVVKTIEKSSPKKGLLVSRKFNSEDGKSFAVEKSMVGNSSPQHPLRNDDSWVSRSILGNPGKFDTYFEEVNKEPNNVDTDKAKPISRVGTAESFLSSGYNSTGKKKSLSKQNFDQDPLEEPEKYLDALAAMKVKAQKLRVRELEKEDNLVQYLPVNERFDLNKEGKVLAMWQERQRKWEHIQQQLAKRVGGSTDKLMMNTGYEFRAKNEEYDVLQAAVPIQERFGAESWQMQLRGGAERAVSIGHVFSGLTCEVSTKRVNPAIIRKPQKIHDESSSRKSTFVDPSPSLLLRQKQLQKTLRTLRPHNLGPSHVEGLIVGSQNLFDWAIRSSESYFCELANAASLKSEFNAEYVENGDADHTEMAPVESQRLPLLTVLSSRHPLFRGIQGEIVHRVISFTNSGPTAISYSWKRVLSESDTADNSSLVTSMMRERATAPRSHAISEERDCFFCHNPTGQILPGEYVHSVFSFCSKGSGGNFSETWTLDTLPKAAVRYAGKDRVVGSGSADECESKSAQSVHVPSVVYVYLKGHAVTVDEHHHRRATISSMINTCCNQSFLKDQAYLSLRRVRPPVTHQEMKERKISLFKKINSDMLVDMYPAFEQHAEVQLTYSRLEALINLLVDIKKYAKCLHDDYAAKRCGVADLPSPFEDIGADHLLPAIYNNTEFSFIRDELFPEKIIENFDEIDESEICSSWNYNVATITNQLDTCVSIAETTGIWEVAILKNLQALEKARILEEKRALDSDYEEDDDDEEAGEDDEPAFETAEVYYMVEKACKLREQLSQLVNTLIVRELPGIFDLIRRNMCMALDEAEDFKESSLQKASIKDDTVIPAIPSAFTTEEGETFWASVHAPDMSGGKKAAGKATKGAISDEQKRLYYGSMYELFFDALTGAVVRSLCEADASMDGQLQFKLKENCLSDLHMIAAVRESDIHDKSHVFIKVNGASFVTDITTSAFDVNLMSRRDSSSPIVKAALFGAEHIVLLFEDRDIVQTVEEAASAVNVALLSELELLPKAQQKLICFHVQVCLTVANLSYFMSSTNVKSPEFTVDNRRIVNVYLLNNLAHPDIVPAREPFALDESDDECDAIPIGVEEWKLSVLDAWKSKDPETVSVDVSEAGKSIKIDVVSDVSCALKRLVDSVDGVWLEGDMHSLFPSSTDVYTLCHRENSIVSDRVREMSLWLHCMTHFQSFSSLCETTSGSEVIDNDFLPRHIRDTFTSVGSSRPTFLVTLGGKIRPDKLRALDYLIDMADTIMICGELSIPFLKSTGVQFADLSSSYSFYCGACDVLLQRARYRGVRIILPLDLLTSDEVLTTTHLSKCQESIDTVARDEGGDYDGDISTASCVDTVAGIPYDIGPQTCDVLRKELKSHHIHLAWGTLGCCEMSAFQTGQKTLAEAAAAESSGLNLEQGTDATKQLHNIVIGECSVEWWSRFCDSDGEYEGNLMKKGVLDFSSRSSTTMAAALGQLRSICLSEALRRDPHDNEWDYLTRIRLEPEEEEEEDEEEEDEDE